MVCDIVFKHLSWLKVLASKGNNVLLYHSLGQGNVRVCMFRLMCFQECYDSRRVWNYTRWGEGMA
jgi:hypothetical protein